MAIRTVIVYSSVDGQTFKICQRLKELLEIYDHSVEMASIEHFSGSLINFDKVIIASSVRYGKHNLKIEGLINDHWEVLVAKKSAFVSVNLVARKVSKSHANSNPYVIKFLSNIKWKPLVVGVFAGKLDYKRYSFLDSLMIKLIMLMTKGPVKSDTEVEYTDWKRVDDFGIELAYL